MTLEAHAIHKTFGTFAALADINLRVESGQLAALLGPSGCGKTTLLRLFAGLEQPDAGRIVIDGLDQSGLDVQKRQVGFVFQHYALFRHLSIFENVAFGLRALPRQQRPDAAEIKRRVHEILSLVQLDNQASKMPDQLSGGQRQRVALARSLVVRPRILLLDEPFGALDAKVRKEVRRWLRTLQEELGITTILVTHDQEEALELADRIILMNAGKVEQIGSPEELYLQPANPFVYGFLGTVNLFHGRSGQTGASYARAHQIGVARQAFADSQAGVVDRVSFAGSLVRLEIRGQDQLGYEAEIGLESFVADPWHRGDAVWFAPRSTTIFQDGGTGI